MASTYSTNLKIELQATGENSGTWGTITNTNLGTALEQAIVGYGNPSYASDANLTLTYTDTNAAQAARALVLNVTSAVSLTATRELVVPTIQKQYIVQNNTTGSQSITVKTSAGTGITVPNGRKAHLYVDGTNVIYMDDYVDINGGAIDGTPIGASSASTGAFTTLSASGNFTLSGGTANGVLYLNGSKVATSGSALTFDGTNLTATRGLKAASGGIVVSSFVDGLSVGGYDSIGFLASPGNALAVGGYRAAQWSAVEFYASGSLQATLTSTGLGIGTTPSGYLANKVVISTGTDSNNGITIASATNRNGSIWFADGTTGDQAYRGGVDYQHTTDTLYLYSGGQGNFQLTSSGNLGLGVTPSGWSLFKALQIGTTYGALNFSGSGSSILTNAYYDGTNYKYQNTNAGVGIFEFNISNGNGFVWRTAPSGTAGNNVTLTSVMTLDADGDLGIGTTNPSFPLSVSKAGVTFTGNFKSIADFRETSAAVKGMSIGYDDTSQTATFISTTASAGSNFSWVTWNGSAWAERMRLDSSGNLGIGTSSPTQRLSVAAASALVDITSTTGTSFNGVELKNTSGSFYIGQDNSAGSFYGSNSAYARSLYATGAYPMVFFTNGTERMRLDSSGNLGLGVTPSAWSSLRRAIALGAAGNAIAGGTTNGALELYCNATINAGGNYIYSSTGTASLYQMSGNIHSWNTAASGTAGNTITFTQAATLDANGNFMVGITSSTHRLQAEVASGADRDIFIASVSGASNGFRVQWVHSTSKIHVNIQNLPTSSAGLPAGTLWNDSGTLKVA